MAAALAVIVLAGCSAEHKASYEQAAGPTAEEQVRAYLQGYRVDDDAIGREARFHLGVADLDMDGTNEAIVWLDDRNSCGTGGCPTLVLRRDGSRWREVARLGVSWPPVRMLESRTNGWRDLAVTVRGGGIIPGYEAVLPFDGRTYPTNPSVPPARESDGPAPGQAVISGDRPIALYPEG